MNKEERQIQLDISCAWEEIKLLHEIVKNQEEWRFKIRGWAVALLTALSVVAFSNDVKITGSQYLALSIVVLLVTCWIDVIYRVAQDRALERANIVEEQLRTQRKYDGPKIRVKLSRPNSIEAQLSALNNIRVYGPYLLLLFIVSVIAYVS